MSSATTTSTTTTTLSNVTIKKEPVDNDSDDKAFSDTFFDDDTESDEEHPPFKRVRPPTPPPQHTEREVVKEQRRLDMANMRLRFCKSPDCNYGIPLMNPVNYCSRCYDAKSKKSFTIVKLPPQSTANFRQRKEKFAKNSKP